MRFDMFVDDKNVGVLDSESINVETEYEYLKDGRGVKLFQYIKSKSYVTDIENVKFNHEFIHSTEQRYKLIGTVWELPKGKRTPKTKRLIKKYKKKYTFTLELNDFVLK